MTGVSFDARIKGFDKYAVVVDVNGAEHLVFKHAIAFIETARTGVNAFSTPHS
jgi:RNA chaperone Hfq